MPQMAKTFSEVRDNLKGVQRSQKKLYDEKIVVFMM